MSVYVVRYALDAQKWWIARVEGVDGVHSNGRSIAQARNRVREALSLAIGDEAAEAAVFEDMITFPKSVRGPVSRARAARGKAAEQERTAIERTAEAAKTLREHGFSVRDSAEALGVSYQRVQQLITE